MSRLYAWLTILAALAVGAVAGNLLVRGASPALQLAGPCLWLAEAQKAGFLTAQKRADLVARLGQSPALDDKGRAIAAMLRNDCPKL